MEEEIQTLSQVLAAKEKHLAEIKRKLGISSLQEFKQNIAKGWQDVTATSAYVPLVYTLLDDVKDAFVPFLWGEEGHEDVCTSFLWTTQPFLPVLQSTRLFSNVSFPEHSR